MTETSKFYQTTAIDYPNSRPHIGTAFEKLGADVQARYRRMQGFDVFFLMGNDENTIKVAKRAEELGRDPKEYCDDMANQFKEVWQALNISYDDFIQTSEPRHHQGCRQFIQKVYDNGYIRKDKYEGWYCNGCEAFKTEKELEEGNCPAHKTPAIRRSEECYFFELSRFQDQLLKYYDENPNFIQPVARRNEILALVKEGLHDINITRRGEEWGIPVPFDEEFTIYVWFDALLNYITAAGYGEDEERFNKWWPADIHFIGKDITRFHCALWPAMCFAAGIEPPKSVFGHGFVYRKSDETGEVVKESKTLGNVTEPMDIITQFSGEAFRYYFMSQCPFPGDGEFSWQRFRDVYNADLANNLGNLYSRVTRLLIKNFDCVLPDTKDRVIGEINADQSMETITKTIQSQIESCHYHQALETVWRQVLDPTNQYAEKHEPWKVVKTDADAAKGVLYDLAEQLRVVSILLKPFLPETTEKIYRSFNFPTPWEEVSYENVWNRVPQSEDLRLLAEVDGGKVTPLFPRIS